MRLSLPSPLCLLLLAAGWVAGAAAFDGGRQRTCCPYSSGKPGSTCSSARDCVLAVRPPGRRGAGSFRGELRSPPGGQCRVLRDSKRSNASGADCLGDPSFGESLDAPGRGGDLRKPAASVSSYILTTDGAKYLPAVNLKVDYSIPWKRLRFRLINEDVCRDSLPHCKPRCVDVERQGDPLPDAQFTYDCEVGFYPSETRMTATTSGNTYRLDLCLDDLKCGSYLFRMPDLDEIEQGGGEKDLILVDSRSLLKRKRVVLHFPDRQATRGLEVGLMRLNSTFVETFPVSGDDDRIGGHLEPGIYQIVLVKDDEVDEVVARFELKHEKHPVRSTSVWVVIFLIVSTLLSLMGYFRYAWIKKINKIDLQQASGKKLLVITDLENRHHVDIVLQFNRYLKDECGVSEVYFAMDPDTGISAQAEGDPWKWAQEATDKVSETGHILILASPPKNMGLDIYKDFTDKQAYVSTKVLRQMEAEGGVSVAAFSYSDGSLPSVLPDHLKDRGLTIPQHMNTLLCQIHRIKKKPICPCVPLAFIEPNIVKSDMLKSASGKEIVRLVDGLSDKVKQHRRENVKLSGDESAPLNRVEFVKVRQQDNGVERKRKEEGLKVTIESKMLSLESGELEGRDPKTTEG